VSRAAPRFAPQSARLARLRRTWQRRGELHQVQAVHPGEAGWPRWPRGRRIVLRADAALDLGTPAAGSLSFLMWSPAAGEGPAPDPAPARHRVAWRGPDISALVDRGDPAVGLGLVIHARVSDGRPAPVTPPPSPISAPEPSAARREYERYLDLKDALYSLELDGVTLRSMPSQQHLWLRLHRDAAAGGFSVAHLGAAVVEALAPVAGVAEVDVMLVTADREALAALQPVADGVQRRVAALVKRHEEELAECDECEYADVCDEREHGP
jgi:hypothetical protein